MTHFDRPIVFEGRSNRSRVPLPLMLSGDMRCGNHPRIRLPLVRHMLRKLP